MKILKYISTALISTMAMISFAFAAPEADFNKIVKNYTLNPDGSMEFRFQKELKINTHLALNNLYGENFIIYNPEFQELKFHSAYTRQADGTIIQMPANAYNEVLPSGAADAPAYNHLKEMVVTHTGLELGATIYLDYSILTKAGYYPQLEIDELLQELGPVKEYTIIVTTPETQPFNYSLTGSTVKPTITRQENMKQISWTLKNIPAASQESFCPVNKNEIPRFTASSYASQVSALEFLDKHLSTTLDENGVNFTKELVKNSENEIDKILDIQQYVAKQVANCRLTLDNTGYQIRPPHEVLRTSYGTPAEKSGLLAAMLKAVNLNPAIAVIYPGTLSASSKGLKSIKDFKVHINYQGTPIFLSATSSLSMPLELRGSRDETWLLSNGNVTPLKITESREESRAKIDIKIDATKATLNGDVQISDGLTPYLSTKETENNLKAKVTAAGKLMTANVTSETSGFKGLSFSAERLLSNDNNYIIYVLPSVSEGIKTWDMATLNSNRKSLFEIPYPIKEVYDYTVELTPDMHLKTENTDVQLNNAIGQLNISIRKNGNNVNIHREIEINKVVITPAEYDNFRKILLAWINPNYNTLIISK